MWYKRPESGGPAFVPPCRPRHTAAVIALACMACAREVPPVVPDAGETPLAPRLLDDESFTETYTAIADLADGVYVQIQLAVSNIGPGSEKGACRLLVVEPGAPAWTATAEIDRAGWRHEAATLVMGPCSARALPDALEVQAVAGAGRASIRFAAPIRPVRPPGGRVDLGDRFYEAEVLVRSADVRADLVLPDRPERLGVVGRGHADHSRSTAMPKALARRWVRIRDLRSGMLLIARFPADGGPPVGWQWAADAEAPTPIVALEVEGAADAWRITQPGREWRTERLLFRHAPVEEQGFLGALVRPLVGNPVTRTFRTSEGLLEITTVDE